MGRYPTVNRVGGGGCKQDNKNTCRSGAGTSIPQEVVLWNNNTGGWARILEEVNMFWSRNTVVEAGQVSRRRLYYGITILEAGQES